jgi:phosphatidylinositol alpha-mannosyltransferase
VVVARAAAMKPRRVLAVACAVALTGAAAVAAGHGDLAALGQAAPGWVVAALALNAVSLVLRGLAWLLMLRTALPTTPVRAGRVLRATMIGVLGSTVLPARAGEPARIWVVARGVPGEGGTATVIGTLVSQTLVNLLALALLAAVATTSGLLPQLRLSALHVVLLPVLAAGLAVAAASVVRSGRIARQLGALRTGVAVFRPARRGLPGAGLQLGAWALQGLAAYVLLRALHLDVAAPLAVAAALLLAVNVTAVVPVTPSNLGVFQAACVVVLAAQGVAVQDGVAYGVLLQAAEIATAVLLGVPALLIEGTGTLTAPRRG